MGVPWSIFFTCFSFSIFARSASLPEVPACQPGSLPGLAGWPPASLPGLPSGRLLAGRPLTGWPEPMVHVFCSVHFFVSEHSDILKIAKAVFLEEQKQNRDNLASGCSTSVYTRNLVPAGPNESSVAKHAGRVPQHD